MDPFLKSLMDGIGSLTAGINKYKKAHQGPQEKQRRIRQIASGYLKAENGLVVE